MPTDRLHSAAMQLTGPEEAQSAASQSGVPGCAGATDPVEIDEMVVSATETRRSWQRVHA